MAAVLACFGRSGSSAAQTVNARAAAAEIRTLVLPVAAGRPFVITPAPAVAVLGDRTGSGTEWGVAIALRLPPDWMPGSHVAGALASGTDTVVLRVDVPVRRRIEEMPTSIVLEPAGARDSVVVTVHNAGSVAQQIVAAPVSAGGWSSRGGEWVVGVGETRRVALEVRARRRGRDSESSALTIRFAADGTGAATVRAWRARGFGPIAVRCGGSLAVEARVAPNLVISDRATQRIPFDVGARWGDRVRLQAVLTAKRRAGRVNVGATASGTAVVMPGPDLVISASQVGLQGGAGERRLAVGVRKTVLTALPPTCDDHRFPVDSRRCGCARCSSWEMVACALRRIRGRSAPGARADHGLRPGDGERGGSAHGLH